MSHTCLRVDLQTFFKKHVSQANNWFTSDKVGGGGGWGVTSNSCQVKQAQLFIASIYSPDMQVKLHLIRSLSGDFASPPPLGEIGPFFRWSPEIQLSGGAGGWQSFKHIRSHEIYIQINIMANYGPIWNYKHDFKLGFRH